VEKVFDDGSEKKEKTKHNAEALRTQRRERRAQHAARLQRNLKNAAVEGGG
jgi:hypothetical protein